MLCADTMLCFSENGLGLLCDKCIGAATNRLHAALSCARCLNDLGLLMVV